MGTIINIQEALQITSNILSPMYTSQWSTLNEVSMYIEHSTAMPVVGIYSQPNAKFSVLCLAARKHKIIIFNNMKVLIQYYADGQRSVHTYV